MKKLTRNSVLLLIVLIAISCVNKGKQEAKSDPVQFENYISGYTSGIVSAKSTVLVGLSRKVETLQPGTEIPGRVFSLKPSVSGKAFLVDPFTVEFRPDQPLEQGRQYLAEFKLGDLFETEKDLQIFDFTFSVINQDFTVYPGRLSASGTDEQPVKRYEGKFVSADEISMEDAGKLLSATSPAGKMEVEVNVISPREFSYSIENIPRKEDGYVVTLSWNGAQLGIEKSGSLDVRIPSVDEFSLLHVKVDQSASNQNIQLVFSDPLDPSQNLSGLISIKQFDDFKMTRKGAVVGIYPKKRRYGQETIVVESTVKSSKGKSLGKRQEYVVALEAVKPEVTILGTGVIMPDSRDLILPFKSVSLRAVDVTVYKIFADNISQFFQNNNYQGGGYFRDVSRPVFRKLVRLDENPDTDLKQWNAFSVDLSGMISHDPNAMYRVRFSFRKEYAVYDCGETTETDLKEFEEQPLYSREEKDFYDGNRSYYYDYNDDFNWRDRDNPCSNSFYTADKFPERNLLASNLGIIAKSADGETFTIAVTDLLTTAPVSSANVEFYNFQQQLVGSGTTNTDGMVSVSPAEIPYLLLAKKDGQQSWLRLDDGSALSVSNFDVSGQKISGGIKGMIYGERGVWRPGDTLFLTFVMDAAAKNLPENHPVVMELFDARGQLANREVKTKGINGFYTYRLVTDSEAPTGNWTARVSVGGASFDKQIKIETVKPNRLKINLSFNRDVLSKNDAGQKGSLKVKWLHGADASNLKAKVSVQLLNMDYTFKGFEGYAFSDPSKNYWPDESNVFDGKLDGNGAASFPLDMDVNYYAPGMLRAVFNTRVFEEGGDFSTDVYSIPFAPFDRFVGVQVPEGGDYKNMLTTDTTHVVKVVTVDKNGTPVSVDGLEVRIYKVSWRWWWSSGEDNLANWTHGEDADVIMQKTFSTKNGKASLSFRIDYPDWGRYLIQVTDPEGRHSTGIPVYVDWPSYISRDDRGNQAGATILSVSTDKEKYETGEMAKVTFPSTRDSRALLSFENGSEILSYKWLSCEDGETTFQFEVTPEMSPNVYAYVTLLQPHAQTVNDLPIRLYGVVPLMVENPATILKPLVKVPDEVRPQSSWQVEVSEKNGRPMTYTLAVVDEGLLDLTRFRTPNPWDVFYAREALGVRTWDLFDEVLGAYSGSLQKVLAIGGDEEALKEKNKKANRFKPVVEFFGPFTLDKKGTAIHKLSMPNYVGSVKVMVVAGYDGAWGSAEAAVPVRQPVMVLPTAPRVVGPDEEFDLPVAVFAMNDNVKNVSIEVKTEGSLSLTGVGTTELTFQKAGEEMAYFRVKAAKVEGIGKIIVTATAGRETASAEIELDIRNPNAYSTRVETSSLDAGSISNINIDFFGMDGTNSAIIEISGMPSFNLEKNLKYLIRYPYGCVEQVTSSVFPQLFLDELTELDDARKVQIDNNIRQAISKLVRFQTADGGLSYWPGGNYVSYWGSVYAGHFLLLAEQKGYLLPSTFKKRWIDWQYTHASNFVAGERDYIYGGELMQAYRLYTLALAGQPNMSAMNRLRESTKLSKTTRWRLAAAYLLAGMPEVADDLIQNEGFELSGNYEPSWATFGSALRDRAMILEVLVMMKKDEQAFDLATKMAREMSTDYMSTQTGAYALYAMARFAHGNGGNRESNFEYTLNGKKVETRTKVPVFMIELNEGSDKDKKVTIKNKGENNLYLTKTTTGRPLQGVETDEAKNLQMVVKYQSIDGKPLDVLSLQQGTDFEAVVTISNPGLQGNYENLALAQVFPSGWEILNIRYTEMQNAGKNDAYDYQDIRDDRVFTFFNLRANQSVTYKVSLNAAYTGRFYLPGAACEAMYDNTIFARQKGSWIKVIR